jgi:outer membrane protein OmpA-like peptidoglycan-associated protein
MRLNARIRIIILSLALVTNGAFADTSIQKIDSPKKPSAWRLFGGVGTGLGLISGSEFSESPAGPQVLLGLHLSYQMRRWEFEAGAGWIYSTISGADLSNLPVTIRTRSGLADLSARYRLTDHWQLGPVVTMAFGTDTGYAPSIQNSFATTFAGLKGVYEFSIQDFPLQAWTQLSTDVSISNRQAYLALAGIQIGFPFSGRSSSEGELIRFTQSAPIRETRELRIPLDPQKVFFSTNSSKLKKDVQKVLEQLGYYLYTHPEQIAELEIDGHADHRGSYELNLKLSKKRSQSVQKAILKAGMNPDKLKVQAYSFSKPVDYQSNKKAWAKNRRVELVFQDVQDPTALREILLPLTEQKPHILN